MTRGEGLCVVGNRVGTELGRTDGENVDQKGDAVGCTVGESEVGSSLGAFVGDNVVGD